jgi:integrase
MKAKSAFITPLSGLALDLLRPYVKTDPTGPVFDLPRYYLHHAAKLIVTKLGMARWTPHDLRRTAATILDREGYSLEQIGALARAHPQGCHSGLRAVGQVRSSTRNGDGHRKAHRND